VYLVYTEETGHDEWNDGNPYAPLYHDTRDLQSENNEQLEKDIRAG